MTAFRVECPGCHISFPVDSDTMRVIVKEADRCNDQSCVCNQEPEPAA